jgi:hypothetical protein
MVEIMARIGSEGRVELVDDVSAPVKSIAPMTPLDAAYLARGMLACAVMLSGQKPPTAGRIISDAHLPVAKWVVGMSTVSGEPILMLSIASGIDLVFVMTRYGAIEMGSTLVSQGQGSAPPGGDRGMID